MPKKDIKEMTDKEFYESMRENGIARLKAAEQEPDEPYREDAEYVKAMLESNFPFMAQEYAKLWEINANDVVEYFQERYGEYGPDVWADALDIAGPYEYDSWERGIVHGMEERLEDWELDFAGELNRFAEKWGLKYPEEKNAILIFFLTRAEELKCHSPKRWAAALEYAVEEEDKSLPWQEVLFETFKWAASDYEDEPLCCENV